MRITKISTFTGKIHTLDLPVTRRQLEAWKGGMLIQEAFPHLTSSEREFMLTGVTEEEWNKVLLPEEDEGDYTGTFVHAHKYKSYGEW